MAPILMGLAFIASKNPTLAIAILKSYKETAALSESDPAHPDEDFNLVFSDLENLLK